MFWDEQIWSIFFIPSCIRWFRWCAMPIQNWKPSSFQVDWFFGRLALCHADASKCMNIFVQCVRSLFDKVSSRLLNMRTPLSAQAEIVLSTIFASAVVNEQPNRIVALTDGERKKTDAYNGVVSELDSYVNDIESSAERILQRKNCIFFFILNEQRWFAVPPNRPPKKANTFSQRQNIFWAISANHWHQLISRFSSFYTQTTTRETHSMSTNWRNLDSCQVMWTFTILLSG